MPLVLIDHENQFKGKTTTCWRRRVITLGFHEEGYLHLQKSNEGNYPVMTGGNYTTRNHTGVFTPNTKIHQGYLHQNPQG